MIVFSPSQRNARRSRKVPTVASVVRVLGTVRVSEGPEIWTPRTSPARPA